MRSQPYQLSKRSRGIILALSRALVDEPDHVTIKDRDEVLIQNCEKGLREFPPLFRIGFIMTFFFFDRLTWLFGVGIKRFVNLKPDRQKKYIARWMNHRSYVLRESIKSMRGFILLNYFSHRDVWRYLEYDPLSHARERILLREKLMAQQVTNLTLTRLSSSVMQGTHPRSVDFEIPIHK
ncbi:MAG: hypothetical protein HQM16_09325 [Deltaproteobacteria bacterium]|nr:hypothetical protein [Deltaproteobacteria bacterium]